MSINNGSSQEIVEYGYDFDGNRISAESGSESIFYRVDTILKTTMSARLLTKRESFSLSTLLACLDLLYLCQEMGASTSILVIR